MRGLFLRFLRRTKIPLFLNTHRLIILLLEWCETIPRDIFGASDYQLKCLRNILISNLFFYQIKS